MTETYSIFLTDYHSSYGATVYVELEGGATARRRRPASGVDCLIIQSFMPLIP